MAAPKKTASSKTRAAAKPAAKTAKKPAAKTAAKTLKKPPAKSAKKPAAGAASKSAKKPSAKAAASKATKAKAKPAKKAAPTTTESLVKTVKRAAAKVVQAAAQQAVKVLASKSAPEAGSRAPEFELSDEKGAKVSSSDLAGKPYVLYFYPKDDTPGCTKEACDIRDNFARFGRQGIRVLGVSPDSEKSHAKFGKKYGLPFTLLSDPDKTLASAYGVWALKQNYGKEYMGIVRSTFLVGSDGTIKKAYRGVKVNGHVEAILSDAQELL